jgi:hypothetical protein
VTDLIDEQQPDVEEATEPEQLPVGFEESLQQRFGQPADEEEPAPEEEPEGEEPEGPPPAAAEAEATEERPDWLPDNFKNVKEFLRSQEELQQLLDRQGQELGELRPLKEQMERLEQLSQPRYDQDELEVWFDENPTQIPYIAEEARQKQDGALYEQAMEAWHAHNPRQAAAYERRLELTYMQQQFDERLNQVAAPVQEQEGVREFARVLAEVEAEHPDIQNFGDAILEAAQTTPEVVSILQRGTYDSKKRVVESLYWMARGRQADTLREAAETVAREQQDKTRRQKAKAGGATASTSPAAVDKSAIDRFKQSILDAPTI